MQPERTDTGPLPALAPVLRASGLSWQFPGQPQPVLKRVGLGVWPGQMLSVIGVNGAGKTTLLRAIAGLIDAAGEVSINGWTIRDDRVGYHRRIGLLTAGNSGLYARLKVRQQLLLWARSAYVPVPERDARIDESLTAFDLDELQDRRTDRLSMGQRQRLRLALTFLHHPDLVLLDEPVTSLDEAGAKLLERACRRHRLRGGAIVWCSPGTPGAAPEGVAAMQLIDGRLLPA